MGQMNETWQHFCNNKIIQVNWNSTCSVCGVGRVEESLRYQGIATTVVKKSIFAIVCERIGSIKTNLTKKKKTYDEHQDSYYDRNG